MTGTHGEPMLHRNSTLSCFGLQWFSFPRKFCLVLMSDKHFPVKHGRTEEEDRVSQGNIGASGYMDVRQYRVVGDQEMSGSPMKWRLRELRRSAADRHM
ncbi:hypothetical protein AB1N83_014275 [Pleurotus pulmonarius]